MLSESLFSSIFVDRSADGHVTFLYYLQLEIPKLLHDVNTFTAWMSSFHNLLERPVPVEGQPTNPEQRKVWGWWKVKKWTLHIMNRLYNR